jgi:hypothetical protein
MTARTLIGSGPHRRSLPPGREAVERAIRMSKFWGAGTLAADCPTTYSTRVLLGAWLPAELRGETVEQLRERLRGYP